MASDSSDDGDKVLLIEFEDLLNLHFIDFFGLKISR